MADPVDAINDILNPVPDEVKKLWPKAKVDLTPIDLTRGVIISADGIIDNRPKKKV